MPTVHISARIINWPPVCACCCRPADTSIEVESTRQTGVKVIRTEAKSWRVPYCRRCLDHIEVANELREFDDRAGSTTGCLGIVGFVVALIVFFLAYRHSLFLAILLTFLVVAVTVTAEVLLYPRFQREYLEQLETKRQQKEEIEQRLAALQCGGCSCDDRLAASYRGWAGTVHTFHFVSQRFAGYFCHHNRGKIVSDGQIHH